MSIGIRGGPVLVGLVVFIVDGDVFNDVSDDGTLSSSNDVRREFESSDDDLNEPGIVASARLSPRR
jgi:hypothetical protein